MERLKDFLHDNTDIFVALLIALAMFSVVAVNLGDWFKLDSGIVMADEGNNDAEAVPEGEEEEAPPVEEQEEEEPIEEEPVEEEHTEEVAPPVNETPQTPPPTAIIVEIVRVVIPDGTPGIGIANILKEKGLISDTSEFVRVSEALNLGTKLKSGTFDIPSNATIEEIVKTVARQK